MPSEGPGEFPVKLRGLTTTGTKGSTQLSVDERVRGRVPGVYGIVWGVQPPSGTQAVFLSRLVGAAQSGSAWATDGRGRARSVPSRT